MFFSWDDLELPGNSFGRGLADGALDLGCQLWNKFPDQWVQQDNPSTSPVKFFWNKACESRSVNKQPPPPSFSGGQCPVDYVVWTRATFRMADGRRPTDIVEVTVEYTFNRIRGPLNNTLINNPLPTQPNFGGSTRAPVGIVSGRTEDSWDTVGTSFSGWNDYTDNRTLSHTIVRVQRLDGQPDNCGSLPTVFPPTVRPQPGQETTIKNFDDGGDTNLSVPFGWFDIDFSVPVTLQFNVGKVVIDVGGINVEFDNQNEWRIEESPDDTGLPEDINNTIRNTYTNTEEVKDILEKDRRPFEEFDYDVTVNPESQGEEIEDPEIEFVKITMTQVPKKGKAIIQDNSEDNDYFIGYFSWTVDGYRAEQIQIKKAKSIFKKPNWATGYTAYAVNNSRFQITLFKTKNPPNES